MKWVAISGSWRKINKEVENDVRKTVREIMKLRDLPKIERPTLPFRSFSEGGEKN